MEWIPIPGQDIHQLSGQEFPKRAPKNLVNAVGGSGLPWVYRMYPPDRPMTDLFLLVPIAKKFFQAVVVVALVRKAIPDNSILLSLKIVVDLFQCSVVFEGTEG